MKLVKIILFVFSFLSTLITGLDSDLVLTPFENVNTNSIINSTIIEQLNTIPRGGNKNQNDINLFGLIVPNTNPKRPTRGQDRLSNLNPNPKMPGGSGGSSYTDLQVLKDNRPPPLSQWAMKSQDWEDDENPYNNKYSPPDTDFGYMYDYDDNPILLIPTEGCMRQELRHIKITFDQTSTHLHHAADHGISLPQNFDLKKFDKMSNSERIEYAKLIVSRDTIIAYQNKLGREMSLKFNRRKNFWGFKQKSNLIIVEGVAGKWKKKTYLVFTPRYAHPWAKKPNSYMMGIVRVDGQHISSFPIKATKFDTMEQEGFWVLKKRNIY